MTCRLDGVRTVVDGALTGAAWLKLGQFVLGFGAAGALGGLAFALTLKLASALPTEPTKLGSSPAALMGIAALILLLIATNLGGTSIDDLLQPSCGAMIP
jgi:hypothetical protein